MKPFYIRIHFDGPYVTGFIVPQANDKQHAIRILKKMLKVKIVQETNNGNIHESMGNDNVSRLKQYMRSLKRPWRMAGGNRKNGEKKMVFRWKQEVSDDPVVCVDEMILPCFTDYWIRPIIGSW